MDGDDCTLTISMRIFAQPTITTITIKQETQSDLRKYTRKYYICIHMCVYVCMYVCARQIK